MRMTSSVTSLQIISALASSHRPLEKAEICLESHIQQNTCKKRRTDGQIDKTHGHWGTQLIQDLCSQEPVIEASKLVFVPKISLLPVDVQRNILSFLVRHNADISADDLDYLLPTLKMIQGQDDWCDFHIATLLNHFKSKSKYCHSQTEQQSTETVDCLQKISKTGREGFHNLCRELSNGNRDDADTPGCSVKAADRCNLHFDWMKFAGHDASVKNVTNERTLQKDETSIWDQKEEKGMELTNEVVDDQRKQTHYAKANNDRELQNEAAEITTGDVIDLNENSHSGDTSPTEKVGLGGALSNQDMKKEILENQSLLQEPSNEEKSKIDESLKKNLDLLKNELHACSTGSVLSREAQEALTQILHGPTEIAENLWTSLCISDVPLVGLECLCQFVIQTIGPAELSYTAASIMASRCFYKKLIDTANAVPRLLSSTLFNFTKAFPKPSIGVLVTLVTSQDFTSSHCDLVAKMSKDVLHGGDRIYLLNGLLESKDLQWSEKHTGLIQSILNTKPDLDQKSVSTLVTSLVQAGMVHHSCKKFAKLLLFIINQYGKQMTTQDLKSMQGLVAANQTFLKKAALNALKKFASK